MRYSLIRGAGSPHIWYIFGLVTNTYLARPSFSHPHHYKQSVAFPHKQNVLIQKLSALAPPYRTHYGPLAHLLHCWRFELIFIVSVEHNEEESLAHILTHRGNVFAAYEMLFPL